MDLFGPQHTYQYAVVKRSLSEIDTLRVMTFNVENLFMSTGKYQRLSSTQFSTHPKTQPFTKPEEKVLGLLKAIDDVSPDIAIITEIEKFRALVNFSNRLRTGPYDKFLIKGNDPRGINIGIIVKSNLPFRYEYRSFRHRKVFDPVDKEVIPIFSRDLPVLMIYTQDKQKPSLLVIGNHLKSMRDRPGDPFSEILRKLQIQEIRKVILDLKKEFPNTPMILAGDFNTRVSGPVLSPLQDVLRSSFDLAIKTIPQEERITHSFHPEDAAAEYKQIDDIMVSTELKNRVLRAAIYRYRNRDGAIKPLPRSYDERAENPSDHFPIFIDLNVKDLL